MSTGSLDSETQDRTMISFALLWVIQLAGANDGMDQLRQLPWRILSLMGRSRAFQSMMNVRLTSAMTEGDATDNVDGIGMTNG